MRPITEEELAQMSRPSPDMGYTSEPSVSAMTGLLNMLGIENDQVYSQPLLFGEDASLLYGRSPDYPKYRDYEDYVSQVATYPTPENYVIRDKEGNMFFDDDRFDMARQEYYKMVSNKPTNTDWY